MHGRQHRRKPAGIKHILVVGSGKGGVGKTTVSTNLALALSQQGHDVGLLDADLYGPNVAMLLGIRRTREAGTTNWREFIPLLPGGATDATPRIPSVNRYGISAMSPAFLMADTQFAQISSGLMEGKIVESLLYLVDWGDADTLVIDLPPGSDEPLATIVSSTDVSGGIIVTTPQDIDRLDAKREIQRFGQALLPLLGLVENMSYFVCGHCGERQDVFHRGGVYADLGVPLLGEIPLEPGISASNDTGRPIVEHARDSPARTAFLALAEQVWQAVDP